MSRRAVLAGLLPRLPLAVAVGLALIVIAVLRGCGWPAVVAAVGTAAVLAGWDLIRIVRGPEPAQAYRLPGYRRLRPLPSGRAGNGIIGLIVLIMVLLAWLLPGWVQLIGMLVAAAALLIMLRVAGNRRRHSGRHRDLLRTAVAEHHPRFVIYTGRRNDASYQLSMWIPVLERLQLPYVVVLRHREALESTLAVTTAPVLVLPSGSDLDVIMVPGLSVALYVNGVGENSSLVNYRELTHVYLGHGDSDKELSVHPMHAMFDRVFVAGQAAIDRYARAGVIIPAEKFVIVGRPQVAALARADRPIGRIQPPTVLYAPTWRGYNARTGLSSLPVGPTIVRALLKRGSVINFRPHPFSWLGAGERAQIAGIDELLRKDRESSRRPHRLAAEHRRATVAEDFDASDAMITDIGSMLVDYFATAKPYAVVLPPGQQASTARQDFPSTRSAHLIEYAALSGPIADRLDQLLDELLDTDPLAADRPAVASYYLGDHPNDEAPFFAAVRSLLAPEP